MTESTISPLAEPEGPDGFHDEAADGARKRSRLILAGAGGTAALALLVVFVALPAISGGDDEKTTFVPRKRPQAQATAAPTAKPSVKPTAQALPPTANVTFRDPFKPLLGSGGGAAPGPAAPAGPAQPVAQPGQPVVQPSQVPTSPKPQPTQGSTTPTYSSPSSVKVAGKQVTLRQIKTQGTRTMAVTSVDSNTYSPAEGEIFGESFQLLVVDGGTCAQYLVGDEKFALCLPTKK